MSQEAIAAALRGPDPDAAERFAEAVYQALDPLNRALMQGLPGAPLEQLQAVREAYHIVHSVRLALPKETNQ